MSRLYFIGLTILLTGLYVWNSAAAGAHMFADCVQHSSCFCERLRTEFPLQPTNTASNVGFMVVGWRILRRDTLSGTAFQIHYTRAMAGCLAVLGTSSTWFHGTFYSDAQVADNVGMYLVVMCNIAYVVVVTGVFPHLQQRTIFWMSLFALAGVVVAAGLICGWQSHRYIFVALVGILCLGFLWVAQQHTIADNGYLLRATVAMACSALVWWLDDAAIWCFPDSLVQGHSVWHLGCAATVWYFCEYTRVLLARSVSSEYIALIPSTDATAVAVVVECQA